MLALDPVFPPLMLEFLYSLLFSPSTFYQPTCYPWLPVEPGDSLLAAPAITKGPRVALSATEESLVAVTAVTRQSSKQQRPAGAAGLWLACGSGLAWPQPPS